MTNDPIADLLTRIRNAQQRNKKELEVPSSKMLFAVAEILKENGYITDLVLEKGEKEVQKILKITLKYDKGRPAITHLKRVSKPGLRKYLSYADIPVILNGKGICLLSTSRGIMTGDQAKQEKIGGEYLCEIW